MTGYEGNIDRFSGFAELYDRYRFRPPSVLAEILCRYAAVERPGLVVDLGCATGPSTRFWADRADRVVGIDPVKEMLDQAIAATDSPHVEYAGGYGHETGLPDGSADIVTCSQSFHWMEPVATLAEIDRILRPGGVFAAYHYDWPAVTACAPLDAAIAENSETIRRLEVEREAKKHVRWFGKGRHADSLEASGHFGLVRTVHLHKEDVTSAERLVRGMETLGALQELRRMGVGDEELGLTSLAAVAREVLGDDEVPIYVSYVVHVGVKPDESPEAH